MRRLHVIVAAVASLLIVGGCDTRIDPVVTGLESGTGGSATFNVAPSTLTLTTGQSAQLTLNSTRAIGPYTWTSSQPGTASVSNDGLVTAIGPGVATITVTAAADRTVSARATVTVQSASPGP